MHTSISRIYCSSKLNLLGDTFQWDSLSVFDVEICHQVAHQPSELRRHQPLSERQRVRLAVTHGREGAEITEEILKLRRLLN